MTKEEFAELQLCHQQSGKTLKEHLREKGLCYSTYNYWRRKYLAVEEPHGLVPISFRKPGSPCSDTLLFNKDLPSGATLLFPNGLRAHFGAGTESMLMKLLDPTLTLYSISFHPINELRFWVCLTGYYKVFVSS